MSPDVKERVVWIGPEHAAALRAREAMQRAVPDVVILAADTTAAASAHLAADRPVVVVDAAGGPDWARTADMLRLSAPSATLVAWSSRSEDEALEAALAAGFDGLVAGDADWARPLRWARARATSRRTSSGVHHRALFERMRHATVLMDGAGRVVGANPAFGGLLGYADGEYEGRSVLDLLESSEAWPDRAFFEEVLAGRSGGHRGEGMVRRMDGSERRVEMHLFSADSSGTDECRFFAILEDVTESRHAHDTLREREERFHAAFAHSGVAMSMVEVVESWVYANPALQAMFGLPPQFSIGQLVALTHPEDRLTDVELFHEMIAGRRDSYQFEKRYVHPGTQEVLWCLLTVSLERDAAGAPRRVFGTVLDITNRRRAEDALRESEARFRAFFETANAGMGVMDPLSGTMEINPAAQRITELPAHVVSYQQVAAATHPDDLAADRVLFTDVLEGRRELYELEKRFVHADGSTVWGRLNVTCIRGDDGLPRVMFMVLDDVTQRKRSEEALRQSELSIRALHGIVASDLEDGERIDRLLELGRDRFGLSTGILSRISDRSFEVLQAVSDDAAVAPGAVFALDGLYCARTIEESGALAIEHAGASDWRTHPAYARTGLQCYLGAPVIVDEELFGTLSFGSREPRAEPFSDADRDFLRLMAQWIGGQLGRARAKAALNEREAQLRQSQKMEAVGRLAGGVAHDFNNLLMGIKGHVELLLQKSDWDDATLEDLFEINHAAVRSQRLVQQLMAFSRKQVLQPEVLDLNLLVDDVSRMLKRLLGEHVELVCELAPALGSVLADQGQLEQVLVNLAVNARDAMPDGGTLSIRTSNEACVEWDAPPSGKRVTGRAVVLTVSDTGTGMDEHTQQRIFEPFFTTKDPDKGTGLGLATVYGIVKQSGGVISVTSAPGSGTTFRICLPRSGPGAADTRPAVQVGPVNRRTGSETVLLVEDELMIRKLTRRMLEQCGYRVLAAADGASALDLCRSHAEPIHLLLTDMVMPGIHGRDLARQVAALRPDIRIVYMSGYTGDQALDLAELEEDAAFLQKPVDLATLARTVRGVLDLPHALAR